ncbi:MAG: TolC family protein [Steroidobacteraceae bacterium]
MKPVFARALAACAGMCLTGLGGALHAAGGDATRDESRAALTLERAVELAMRRNPELAASVFELTAGQARVAQAALRANPELALEFENFAGSGAAHGTDALETTLSLSQVIELGGKRGRRVGAARAAFDLVGVEQQARQLDVLAQVTTRFIDVVALQERVRFAGHSRDLAQRTLDAIAARVTAGRTPEAERSRARIALLRVEIDERQAHSALRGARRALASLWGEAEPRFGTARADLYALPPVAPLAELEARIGRNPDIARFASEARLREAELALARAGARPNLALGLGVRRLGETSDTALVAGFSMALPAFGRNQGTIREAEARISQSTAAREAALIRVRSTLFGLYEQMVAVRDRGDALRDRAVPQARIALEQTRYGYDRGRFSFLELVTAQQELLELEAAAIDAATDYHRLLAELERITSEPLTLPVSEAPAP